MKQGLYTNVPGKDRRGRTEQDMKADFIRGHCGEVYLLDHQGFSDDLRDYQDVLEKDTLDPTAVEVTTIQNINNTKNSLRDIKNDRSQAYRNIPDKLIIFTNNNQNTKFTFHAKYIWEDKDWKES